MSTRVSIKVLGDDVATRYFYNTGNRAANAEPAWPVIRARLQDIVWGQFQSQGARGGSPWEELSQEWMAHKATHGLDPRIGRAEGELLDSLTMERHEDQIDEGTEDTYSFGSRKEQFPTVEYGGASGSPPARPMVVVTPQDERRMAYDLMDYIVQEIGGVRMLPRQGAGGRFLPEVDIA